MKRIRVPISKLLAAANGGEAGLRCPKCGCVQFGQPGRGIRETRQVEGFIQRVRVCRNCGHTWKTIEQ